VRRSLSTVLVDIRETAMERLLPVLLLPTLALSPAITSGQRETERERQREGHRERQTETERDRERDRDRD